MQTPTFRPEFKIGLKIALWGLVALYTFILPDAIIIYRAIVGAFGQGLAGRVPIIIVGMVGIGYVAAILISQKKFKNCIILNSLWDHCILYHATCGQPKQTYPYSRIYPNGLADLCCCFQRL